MLDDAVRFFDLLSIDYLIDKVTLICNEQLLLDIGICCTNGLNISTLPSGRFIQFHHL